jgi:4-hydroxy-tetrahydrodipicolinate synthase
MTSELPIRGVFCAAATPMRRDLSPDLPRFIRHCHQLIADGCAGVALLGTTGEANSFDMAERRTILETAVAGGIAPDKLLPGTGAAAFPDAVALTVHALSLGVTRVVMLPPFYYKGVSDDGLFAAYRNIVERIADDRLRIVLYNIPQMSGIALSIDLIGRLIDAYPKTFVGIKDSAGNFENMQRVIEAFPGFSVLAGADPLMLPLLRIGGAGCITATSNLVAAELATVERGVLDPHHASEIDRAQARIEKVRSISNRFAQIPTIKAMLAHQHGAEDWLHVRPPLVPLTEQQRSEIANAMAEVTSHRA